MCFEAGLALAIAGAAGGAANATYGAVKQNKAAKSASDDAKRKAGVQVKQLRDAADVEIKKRSQDAAKLRGRLAVLGAESGVSGGYNSLEQQVEADLDSNIDIIARSLDNNVARVNAGLGADLTGFKNQTANALLASATGALTGLSTGLSIGQAFQPKEPELFGDERDFFA